MIDGQVFRTSREVARCKIPPDVAKNSFGYYIDIPNGWESYRTPEELVGFLGIHTTHAAQYLEIIEDLGQLTKEELDWASRYVEFYANIAKLLCSTGAVVEFKHDIAETIFDWRTILKFAKMPCKVLDYGAGCARQGTSAFLRNRDNLYVAVDSTLAAYTLQNLVLSGITVRDQDAKFHDFLDFEAAGKPLPDISKAGHNARFHIPAWLAEANVPEKFFDVMIAVHVHNELSGPDFLRLVNVFSKGLSDNGIIYVRSELTAFDTKDYFDAIDLHGLDIIEIFRAKGIVPVFCKYESAFLTTVFARVGSAHHKNALNSKAPENSFTDVSKGTEASARAAAHFVERTVHSVAALGRRTALIGKDAQFFEQFISPATGGIAVKEIFTEGDFFGDNKEDTKRRLADFNPEVIIVASQQLYAIEAELRNMLPDTLFPLRRHYWYPVSFLYKESGSGTDKLFSRSIHTAKDVDGE
ncbi:MAG: hypothetical protein WA162_03840 [Thermodesulfobacteriota bacterium]